MHRYWYDFLYLYPEMPEWQVKLQKWANEVYGAPKVRRLLGVGSWEGPGSTLCTSWRSELPNSLPRGVHTYRRQTPMRALLHPLCEFDREQTFDVSTSFWPSLI